MAGKFTSLVEFFESVPWWNVLIYVFLSTFLLGNLSTYLRKRFSLKDGYSRKINHVGIMLISAPTLAFLPDKNLVPGVIVGSILLILIYTISALSSQSLIHGIVSGSLRQRDNPHKRFFFFFPLVTFNLSLILVSLIFPLEIVRIAFFTVALADGFAEPIGLRFGRSNAYRIKDFIWKSWNTKSAAGSFTVFAFSVAVSVMLLSGFKEFGFGILIVSLLYGALISVLEAISPRGTDNMLIVLVSPLILTGLLRFIP